MNQTLAKPNFILTRKSNSMKENFITRNSALGPQSVIPTTTTTTTTSTTTTTTTENNLSCLKM